jgi:hypothetical protein
MNTHMELHRQKLTGTWYFQPGVSSLRHRVEVYQDEPGGRFGFYIFEDLPDGDYRLVSTSSKQMGTAEEALAVAEGELKRWLESGAGFRAV